jgi:selenocysteine lyase/cysteine desulfurase
VDATQSAGQVPIDVTASGVDVLITGSYRVLGPDHSDTLATRDSLALWRAKKG